MALVAEGVASVGFNETVWLLHRSPLQHIMLQSSKDLAPESSELKRFVKPLQPSVMSAVIKRHQKVIISKNLSNKIYQGKEKRLSITVLPDFQPKEEF